MVVEDLYLDTDGRGHSDAVPSGCLGMLRREGLTTVVQINDLKFSSVWHSLTTVTSPKKILPKERMAESCNFPGS
jgi:hypothetical protein